MSYISTVKGESHEIGINLKFGQKNMIVKLELFAKSEFSIFYIYS